MGQGRGMDLLLAEDLMLLLLDDETGAVRQTHLRPLLGGAVLADLALGGAVDVEEKRGFWHTARVHPVAGRRPADPVLAAAYDEVAAKPRSAQDLVNRIGKPLKDDLTDRLVERGLVRREEHRVLGLYPTTRWPAEDAAHEQEVRRRLGDLLVRGLTPDPRTVALVALLTAVDLTHKVVDREGLSGAEVRKRGKTLVEQMDDGEWAAKAVRDAVAAITAAAATAAVAGGAAAASS